MSRLPRYVIPGQPQHIIQRGNNRQAIFAAGTIIVSDPIYKGLLLLALISIALSVGCNKTITSAPEVTFTTITGKKIALKDLRGKPVMVTFWATDCPSCVEEIPHLIDLYTQYK